MGPGDLEELEGCSVLSDVAGSANNGVGLVYHLPSSSGKMKCLKKVADLSMQLAQSSLSAKMRS